MDSLSFTFLSYISWEMGALCLTLTRSRVDDDEAGRRSIAATLLASLFMMCLDIVIDPVALRGDRWFLGKLYFYPEGGSYFGVTIANFLGWFLVCFVILRTFLLVDRWALRTAFAERGKSDRIATYGAVLLYFGVLVFNLTMTFWIGEILLGLMGLLLTIALAAVAWAALYYRSKRLVDTVSAVR
jgi:putative membrane protein